MTQDKKKIPQTPELILEQVFTNLNNLREALNIQANNKAKIEPVIIQTGVIYPPSEKTIVNDSEDKK